MLQVSGNTLQQVDKFNCLRVVFVFTVTAGGTEIDTQTGKSHAVLREF